MVFLVSTIFRTCQTTLYRRIPMAQKSNKFDSEVDTYLLERSSKLSWDENELINYIRNHPEKIDKLLEEIKRQVKK